MSSFYKYKTKHAIHLFFIIYLIIGLIIIKDFGISIDEAIERKIGIISFEFVNSILGGVFSIDKIYNIDLMYYDHRNYGSILQIVCYIIERSLHLNDPRQYFLLRHIVVFTTFWYSTYIFYKLIYYVHNSEVYGILGAITLILTPRIFGDSFFNPKDIPFLSSCIFYAFMLYKLNKKWRFGNILILAFLTALAIGIRVVGTYLVFITIGMLLTNKTAIENWTNMRLLTTFKRVIIYMILVLVFTIILWPSLWINSIDNFIYSFKSMANFNWDNPMLFLGKNISGKSVPFYYSFVWILATTPLLFVFLFFVGFIRLSHIIINKIRRGGFLDIGFSYVLAFIIPFILVILLKSTLYNGWRHLYFTYPFFIIILTYSYKFFHYNLNRIILFAFLRIRLMIVFNIVIIVYFIGLIWQISRFHPHQSVFFNIAFSSKANELFEIDYYGLTYISGLKYICDTDIKDTITIYGPSISTELNILFLPQKQRKRVLFRKPWESDYILTNGLIQISDIYEYRYIMNLQQMDPIKTINRGNIDLLQIFKQ